MKKTIVFVLLLVAALSSYCLSATAGNSFSNLKGIKMDNWIVESLIEDETKNGTVLRGIVLRNVDPRDLAGTGGQAVVTSSNEHTLNLLLESLGVDE